MISSEKVLSDFQNVILYLYKAYMYLRYKGRNFKQMHFKCSRFLFAIVRISSFLKIIKKTNSRFDLVFPELLVYEAPRNTYEDDFSISPLTVFTPFIILKLI